MLELKGIIKEYPAGEDVVQALKGLDIRFRNSEFVSILGPSGCGKTTLLNIIGGLDQYTEGDLVINGRSTKEFKARDWDTYRNHSVGFVFQSYNLIPHQTVLQNVELALTLSGVGKAERRERAKQALEQVGLGDQLNKRPGQMSGGQMQRVAIARALVNNPEIILADEPTGALDTETSVQVMEILKEVSHDRLVVMVTHNPDLAEKYSTRIIRMLDGKITDDSEPLTEDECEISRTEDAARVEADAGRKKPSMSFWTAFKLSLKNLFTKRGRTILTAFAGSIGIIGIALILAVSQGMTGYIDHVQEQTLSTYPLTIQAKATDMNSVVDAFLHPDQKKVTHGKDKVYQKPIIYSVANSITSIQTSENDLKSFKKYIESELENEKSRLNKTLTGVHYAYNLDLLVYTENVDGDIIESDVNKLMNKLLAQYLGADYETLTAGMGMGMISIEMWEELLPGKNGAPINDLVRDQYDVVYGAWPNDYDEIVLVLDENNELDDMTLYILGLLGDDMIDSVVNAIVSGTPLEIPERSWDYEDLCGTECRTILNADCFVKNPESDKWMDLRNSKEGLAYLYDKALPLKISGLIRPKKNAESPMLMGTIGYTTKLTEYVIQKAETSAAVQAQKANPGVDILTGLPFNEVTGEADEAKKESVFRTYAASLDEKGKAETFVKVKSTLKPAALKSMVDAELGKLDRATLQEQIAVAMAEKTGMSKEQVDAYLNELTDAKIREMVRPAMEERVKVAYAEKVKEQLDTAYPTAAEKAAAFDAELPNYTAADCALYYDEVMEFSPSTYKKNLHEMGSFDLEEPSSIGLYTASFKDKDVLKDIIADYNKSVDKEQQIAYTDYVGLIMSSVTQIINAITYVLIAFVAISLIVSSIMVGVITLISVQERTKEIGILRAIGASKRNVSSMFNAETLIIGFAAGLFGVLFTYLLCIPINLILHALTGIGSLSAFLHPVAALILIAISMVLTLISGIIPSRSAAKKDPVVALRTE